MGTLVVAFPKSGRIWLQAMLDQLGIAAKYTHMGMGHVRQRPFGSLDIDRLSRADCLVGLIRDPRDAVVSGYHQCTARTHLFRAPMREFLVHPHHGIDKAVRFNLALMAACTGHRNALLITYEAMHEDVVGVLMQVAALTDAAISIEMAEAASVINSFDQMRARERSGEIVSQLPDRMLTADPAEPNSAKMRRGVVGSHRDELSPEEIRLCDDILARYQYPARVTAFLADQGQGDPGR